MIYDLWAVRLKVYWLLNMVLRKIYQKTVSEETS